LLLSRLKCVIFDMDGTLTETNQLIYDSFNHIARRFEGKTYSVPEITSMFGPPEEGALARIVGSERLDVAMNEYLRYYRANHNRLARLYPGIVEILSYVRDQSCHLALFTGKGIHTTNITLEEFGIKRFFDFVVTGNDVVLHKPSAEGIQKIIDHFQLQKHEVLMVGDSVADLKASREAGVEIASVLWDSYGKEQVLQLKSDHEFHNVQEFHDWLSKRFAEHP